MCVYLSPCARAPQGDDRWHHLDEEQELNQVLWLDKDAPCTRRDGRNGPDAARAQGGAAQHERHESDSLPVLSEWSWTSDGKLTGKVYGKAGYKDGTCMTTSAVGRAQRFHTHVVTQSGTVYLLGRAARSADSLKRSAQSEPLGVAQQRRFERNADLTGVRLECSICREECDLSVDDWSVTPCKHAFHADCLRQWVVHCAEESAKGEKCTPNCPDCRAPLSSSRFRMFELG